MRDVLENKSFEITKIHIDMNVADIMTKTVTRRSICIAEMGQAWNELPMPTRSVACSREE